MTEETMDYADARALDAVTELNTDSFQSGTEMNSDRAAPCTAIWECKRRPLKRSLDERGTFDPKAVAILLEAFDGVVTELALREPAERERAAKLIIRLALGQTNLDAAKLHDGTVAFMRNESGTCLHPVVSFNHGGLIGPPSSEKAAVWVASPVVRLRRSALDGGLFQSLATRMITSL